MQLFKVAVKALLAWILHMSGYCHIDPTTAQILILVSMIFDVVQMISELCDCKPCGRFVGAVGKLICGGVAGYCDTTVVGGLEVLGYILIGFVVWCVGQCCCC